MFFGNFAGYSHQQEEEGEEAAQMADYVSVDGVDGFLVVEVEGAIEIASLPPAGLFFNIASLVDEGADTGVGAAGYAAAVFNCPETCIVQVLFVARGIAPPAVVGNDGHYVGTVEGPLTVKMREYRFVADGRSYFYTM